MQLFHEHLEHLLIRLNSITPKNQIVKGLKQYNLHIKAPTCDTSVCKV